jgi:hypothetical protein
VSRHKEQADFAAKLLQIEEQANRMQHIAMVARMLRSPLEDGSVLVVPGRSANDQGIVIS